MLDPLHRRVFACRVADRNLVASLDVATCQHDAHDPGAAHLLAGSAVAFAVDKHHLQHPVADVADLLAWIAKSGQSNECIGTDAEHGSHGQSDEVDAGGGDVLTQLAVTNLVSGRANFVK